MVFLNVAQFSPNYSVSNIKARRFKDRVNIFIRLTAVLQGKPAYPSFTVWRHIWLVTESIFCGVGDFVALTYDFHCICTGIEILLRMKYKMTQRKTDITILGDNTFSIN